MLNRILKYGIGLVLLFAVQYANAQYFGRNKPQYKQFEFELYKTPHFDIYHYTESDSLLNDIAFKCEQWYTYHQQVLLDTFNTPNPILIYQNHADFQQTNAIHGHIGVGTGGVTEGMKRRVVMPVTFSAKETNHVLGHEMVHAFQYHIMERKTKMGLQAIGNVPLFMIEGMAEYLSIGNTDSHTALWMRDALIHKRFPDLKTLSVDYRYSPYRYGQAFWSYISYQYGEQYINHLMLETANKGMERAITDVLKISVDSLSTLWKQALQKQLLPDTSRVYSVYGNKLLNKKNSGYYNLSPTVSPDGEKVIFLSERDLFSLDLFMADAKTGKLLKKIYTSTRSDKVDAINFMETSGTWSNDSRHFAYVAYIKGESSIIIFDTNKAVIKNTITLEGVDAISYPSWSPLGDEIVFTGLKEGVSNLYIYNLRKETTEQITFSNYCNLQPVWNKNATQIFFATDEPAETLLRPQSPHYNIASIKLNNKSTTVYATFNGADNLNPIIGENNHIIYFLSDKDSYRNLYSLNTSNNSIRQLTFYNTGITGMTALSPAMSISQDHIYYNMLWNGEFSVIRANIHQIENTSKLVDNRQTNHYASRLMPFSQYPSLVDNNLAELIEPQLALVDSFYQEPLKSKFKLDYIGNTAIGVAAGRFGTGMAGSIEARFSDILSEHVIYSGLSVNGEVYDFGGMVTYVNQKRPIKLGVSMSHIPYRTGYYERAQNEDGDTELNLISQRTFIDKFSLFGYYPLNSTHRIESGVSAAHYSYRTEKINNYNTYYSYATQPSEKVESPDAFNVIILDLAYVIDNSKFGLASPVEGKRIRFGYERYFSGVNMNTLLLDYRKYFYVKPYSFAFRLYHYGRFGKGSDSDRLIDMFIGYPWYLRGFETGNFYGESSTSSGKISSSQLMGSKIAITNFEWRIPFTGPKDYAWVQSQFLFSELSLFFDAGIAWNNNSSPTWSLTTSSDKNRVPLMSTGLSWRVNLMGAIVIEPYFAFPIVQGELKNGNFGFNILSGW